MILRPTRREALQYGGAAAALAFGLPRAARATPQRGGVMRVAKGHGQTSDTFDPALWANGFMVAHGYNTHGYLSEVLPDGSLGAEVAESWEPSADAATWRFRVRPGVTFHNGRTVTASDVMASINHHRGEDSQSAAKPIVDPITEIRVEDDIVVFTLAGGNADFPFLFSDYHLVILPANDDGTVDWQAGIGCGPYRCTAFEPGVEARYARHDGYWKSDRAWVDEIAMLSIIDPTARTNALITGEVDAIDRVEPRTAALLGRNPQIAINEVAGTQHYTFAMHADTAPFDDVNVRLALKYGIDREEMVEKVLSGFGVVGNDHPIGPNQRYHNGEMAQRSYDPDRAKFHLREAGLDSLDVTLAVADAAFAGAVDAGQLFQQTAEQAGINLNLNRVPNDGYWSNVWLRDPFCAVYWGGRPTEDWMFATAYEAGVPWNDTNWTNERFNDLLLAARAELDEDRRRAMYYEMQEIVANDGGAIVPMFASYVFATGPSVGHDDTFAANWDMDGEKWGERWWKV